MRFESLKHCLGKFVCFSVIFILLLGSGSFAWGQASNAVQTNQMPPNAGQVSRNPTNTDSPNLDAPNIAKPNTTPPSTGFRGTPNPDGSLPVRPGAIVNPRANTTQTNNSGHQVAQARQPVIPDQIRNTGIPGRSTQPQPQGQNPNAPERPQQAIPNIGQPFPQLTVQEAAELDQFLTLWEKRTSTIKVFESHFQCWEYGTNLLENTDRDKPDFSTYGIIRYAAPNRGSYEILGEIVDGKKEKDKRQSRHITSGEALFEYDFKEQTVFIQKIPEDQQHELAGGGPLAFVFGANPEVLKKRYFLRLNTLPDREKKGEIWLEAYPRLPEDTTEFQRIQLVVDRNKVIPKAFIRYNPNGKGKTTFTFWENTMRISAKADVHANFVARYMQPEIPKGWKRETPGASQAESPQLANSSTTRPLNVQTVGGQNGVQPANSNPAYTNQPQSAQQNPQHNQVRPIMPQQQQVVPPFNPPNQQPPANQNVVETQLYNTQNPPQNLRR